MWIIFVLLGVLIAGYLILIYNTFVSLQNRARNAWADIDVQLKRRYDLVPNLVETVKGYASYEKGVLEDVTRLRSQAMKQERIGERAGTESGLAGAIKSLFAVAENYPELRADKNFRDLQKQLTEIEEHIQYARRYYNAVVRDINTKCEMFPSSLIAAMFGFKQHQYFQADENERSSLRNIMS